MSAKVLNQETKGFVSISVFIHADVRSCFAFLFYVPRSKYSFCLLTTTNILHYEDLATGCQKQSAP